MDEEFDTSVDVSNIDTSADMDTSDVVDDVSNDIPEDAPEDISEDIPEDIPESVEDDNLSEDIPEDVPEEESEVVEEGDLSDNISEDVTEDEPEMMEEDDLSDDVLEDVPEDESAVPEEDDLLDDIPEDIPEDEPDVEEDNLSENIPEDVAEEELEVVNGDDLADDGSENVTENESVAIEENDVSEDVPKDAPEDQVETDDTTTDDTTEDTTSNVDSIDSIEPTNETQDKPTDDIVPEDTVEETTSDADSADAAELTEKTQDKLTDDSTTDDLNKLPTDQYDGSLNDIAINESMNDDVSQNEQVDEHDDSDTLESRMIDDAILDTHEKSAMDRMSDYMNSHNYGIWDRDTYMSDPEWIGLNRDLKAELGIPQTAQEQLMDYMGSHNYGIWDRDTYMKDPEWQSLNEAFQNEIAGVNISNTFFENDIIESTEDRGKVSNFFASFFGSGSQQTELQGIGTSFASNNEVDLLDTTSQILQQSEEVTDNVSEKQDHVKAIEGMDFNDLSDKDKDLMYNTIQKHIGEKYGDLVSEDRINEIPKHIRIADTEECRKAYETPGDKYDDNIVGFYCPATDEIYVDAPRNGDMTEIMATVDHESLHFASNGGLKGELENVEVDSTNLNEGVTELYAIRDMAEMGFDYTSTSYQKQVEVVKALEDAIGEDIIRTAYFNNQPDLLRTEFETAFANESQLQSLESGKTVHNGTYIDFLNSFNQYINTAPNDSNYNSSRDTVYNWISNLKAKRSIN